MKKYYAIVIILVLLVFVTYFPFGSTNYKINDKVIKIPILSFVEEKNKNELIFKSYRDSKMLEKDIEKILSKYAVVEDGNKKYYYDAEQNLLIRKYELKKGFIYNKIIIKYE